LPLEAETSGKTINTAAAAPATILPVCIALEY
jgi:hypothetical protein